MNGGLEKVVFETIRSTVVTHGDKRSQRNLPVILGPVLLDDKIFLEDVGIDELKNDHQTIYII